MEQSPSTIKRQSARENLLGLVLAIYSNKTHRELPWLHRSVSYRRSQRSARAQPHCQTRSGSS